MAKQIVNEALKLSNTVEVTFHALLQSEARRKRFYGKLLSFSRLCSPDKAAGKFIPMMKRNSVGIRMEPFWTLPCTWKTSEISTWWPFAPLYVTLPISLSEKREMREWFRVYTLQLYFIFQEAIIWRLIEISLVVIIIIAPKKTIQN